MFAECQRHGSIFPTKVTPNLNTSARMSWSISAILKPLCTFFSARMKNELTIKTRIARHHAPFKATLIPRKNQKPYI